MGKLVFMQLRIAVPVKIGYGLSWYNLRTPTGTCIFHLSMDVYSDNLPGIRFYVPKSSSLVFVHPVDVILY